MDLRNEILLVAARHYRLSCIQQCTVRSSSL